MRPILLLLAACAPKGDVPDDEVAAASLVNLDTNGAMVIAGPIGGDARLAWVTPDGRGGSVPVSVSGGAVGVVLQLTLDLEPEEDVVLDLSDADDDLRVADLLGTYSGTGWNTTMGIGGAGHLMQNGHGVRLSDSHFTFGVGLEAGLEWLRIRVGGDEALVLDDEIGPGDDWHIDETDDTEDPEDSEVVDTADPPDTDPPDPPDTAMPEFTAGLPVDDAGCGGGGCGGTSPDVETGDCSGGCQDPVGCMMDQCGCSTIGFVGSPFTWAILVAYRRRRVRDAVSSARHPSRDIAPG